MKLIEKIGKDKAAVADVMNMLRPSGALRTLRETVKQNILKIRDTENGADRQKRLQLAVDRRTSLGSFVCTHTSQFFQLGKTRTESCIRAESVRCSQHSPQP